MLNTIARKDVFQSINPVDGTITTTYETLSDDKVKELVNKAVEGYNAWKATPVAERIAVLDRIGDLLTERSNDLAKTAASEMGKPVSQGVGEAEFSSDIIKYYVKHGETLLKDEPIENVEGGTAAIESLPIGVLLGIMPWNYPVYQVARFIGPNLLLGNTILLKHSEITPATAEALEQLFRDAGLPENAYINLRANHAQVADIIADPRIQGVSLTGSERAASAVGEIAGKHRKRTVFELGGSDAHIVLDTNDLAAEVDTAIETRMENTGQACDSNKRIIVSADIYDEFVETLVEKISDLVPGTPQEEKEGTYPPLSSRNALTLLTEQVERAVAQGAELHVGGSVENTGGYYYAPTVLTGVTSEMDAYYEEFFGPVFVVFSVASDQEAVELANDSNFGLGGGVIATDEDRAKRVASQLEVGMVAVNAPGAEGANLPFGGVKGSGYGREIGKLGLDGFVNKRLYFIAD